MRSFNSKILLFGEYTLLYKSKALTMPYDKFTGRWESNGTSSFAKESLESLKKYATFISEFQDVQYQFDSASFQHDVNNGMYFESSIPQGYGLGSSGALVAAFFDKYGIHQKPIDRLCSKIGVEEIQSLRLVLSKLEAFFHGTSSGIDPLSILLNHPLLLHSLEHIETTSLPTANEEGKSVVFLLDTQQQRNTEKLVNQFKERCKDESYKKAVETELLSYCNACISTFLNNEQESFYSHVHQLVEFQLRNMSFLIPDSLIKMIEVGQQSKSFSLKICGAGGGGYMLGFTKDWDKTASILNNQKIEIIYKY